jgi:4-amino-4-deoxy-L-arabinose transferase-like glycosyltransferase
MVDFGAMPSRITFRVRNPQPQIVVLLICLAALALRLGPLFDNRFHPDEALFSTWAFKIARGENLLLTGVPVDKPPLLIYLSALSFYVFGQSELAARVPNLIASVLSVPLLYELARRYWPDDRLLELPALLLALSPFAILFAPTAFLDPAMVMFGLAALAAAARGRAGWAGFLLGLSCATKVQGLFFLPLIPIFWQRSHSTASPYHSVTLSSGHPFWRFLIGIGIVASAVFLWDRARGGLPFWIQQTINYGDIRVIYAGELAPRLNGWVNFLPYFFGPIIGALGLIGLPFLLYRDLTQNARTRAARIDLWLLAYTIGFLALHWLLAFPIWDRYLLILVPITALLLARSLPVFLSSCLLVPRGCSAIIRSPRLSISPSLLLSIILLVMLPFSLAAAESQYPIGGDHGANDGIEQVARYLKTLPSGTVVYDHWLAWTLDYYVGEGFVYLSYFDTPADVAKDLRVFAGRGARYVIFPGRESPDAVIDAIGQVGYTLTPVLETKNRFGLTSFTIYQIVKRET